MPVLRWSPAELSIARALALQVRVMTVPQVAAGWFADTADPRASALTALCRLANAGLVESLTLEAHPLLPLQQPLFVWRAGDPCPNPLDFVVISVQSQARWNRPHVPVALWRATKRASHVWGAFHDARRIRHSEASHDLHFAEVFVRYRCQHQHAAADWLGEAAFPKLGFELKGMKDPDAFLVNETGVAYRVVEFAGSYEADHLWDFHAHCSGRAAEKLARRFTARPVSAPRRPSASRLASLYAPGGTAYELW